MAAFDPRNVEEGGWPPYLGPGIHICDLAEQPLWVAWQAELVTPKGGGAARVTKIPYSSQGIRQGLIDPALDLGLLDGGL
jgi:hypothetical protein